MKEAPRDAPRPSLTPPWPHSPSTGGAGGPLKVLRVKERAKFLGCTIRAVIVYNLRHNMPYRMKCPEHRRLLTLYADATGDLWELTSMLADAASSYESDAFARAWEQCEGARQLCGDIRQQMYDHLERHRCALNLSPGRQLTQ